MARQPGSELPLKASGRRGKTFSIICSTFQTYLQRLMRLKCQTAHVSCSSLALTFGASYFQGTSRSKYDVVVRGICCSDRPVHLKDIPASSGSGDRVSVYSCTCVVEDWSEKVDSWNLLTFDASCLGQGWVPVLPLLTFWLVCRGAPSAGTKE